MRCGRGPVETWEWLLVCSDFEGEDDEEVVEEGE